MSGRALSTQLVRGAAASMAVKAAGTACAIGISVALARALGANGFGIYAYAMAIVGLMTVATQLGLPLLLVKKVATFQAGGDWACLRGLLRRAFQAGFAASLFAALVAAGIALLVAGGLQRAALWTFLLGLALLPLITLGNLAAAALRGLGRIAWGQTAELLLRPGLLLLGILVFWSIQDAAGFAFSPPIAMALHVAAGALALMAALWLLARHRPKEAAAATPAYATWAWAGASVPFILISGTELINRHSDVLMLGIFLPAADVGVYRIAAQGAILVSFTLAAMNAVVSSDFARFHARRDAKRLQALLTQSSLLIFLGALPVAFVLIVFGGDIISLVFGMEFARGHAALAILCLGQLVNAGAGPVGYLLNMTGHARDVAWVSGLAAVLNVVLNLVLIPTFGLVGAASATAISLCAWNGILSYRVYTRLDLLPTILAQFQRAPS